MPIQVYFVQPLPGDFFAISTTPSCVGGTSQLICTVDEVPITNGRYGDTPGNIDPTEFLAWKENSSRFSFIRSGALDTLTAVRQVNLFFYHEPASGIGLPEFNLSGSNFELSMLGNPLTYTILGNQDMTVDDAQVRNVTLALTEPITEPVNRFHIRFYFTDSVQQFAISEIQLCSDEGKIHTSHSHHLL